ncbi:MAG: hypothetical protein AB8B04_09415 [Prochlorococcus sp.]
MGWATLNQRHCIAILKICGQDGSDLIELIYVKSYDIASDNENAFLPINQQIPIAQKNDSQGIKGIIMPSTM